MTPAELTSWRERMGWTAKEAAAQLGLSQNGYAAYERGWTRFPAIDPDGKHLPRPIPKHVALACERLEQLAADSKRKGKRR
jgi:DNA-binding XRE family transcriptional regulator